LVIICASSEEIGTWWMNIVKDLGVLERVADDR